MIKRAMLQWGVVGVAVVALIVPAHASRALAADKAKKPKAADADVDNQQPAFGALADDDEAGVDKPADKNAKKEAAKAKKAAAAAAKKKNVKAPRAKQNLDEEAANEAAMQQQMMQAQQMQQMQGMMGGNGRQRSGNNAYNRSMFLLMRQFDANGNGQLDPQEAQAMKLSMAQMQAGGPNVVMAQMLRQFDANGNGQLDPNEMQAAQAAMTQGMVNPQVGGGVTLPNTKVLPKSQ